MCGTGRLCNCPAGQAGCACCLAVRACICACVRVRVCACVRACPVCSQHLPELLRDRRETRSPRPTRAEAGSKASRELGVRTHLDRHVSVHTGDRACGGVARGRGHERYAHHSQQNEHRCRRQHTRFAAERRANRSAPSPGWPGRLPGRELDPALGTAWARTAPARCTDVLLTDPKSQYWYLFSVPTFAKTFETKNHF